MMLRRLRSKVRMTSVSGVAKVYTCLKFLYVKEDKETHATPIIPQNHSYAHNARQVLACD